MNMGSFSIREYVSRMRSGGDHGIGFGYEPMPCPKYRWWAAELEAERSSSSRGPAGVECQDSISRGERVGRKKSPRKKKRSILELFAVAPQMEEGVVGKKGKIKIRDKMGNKEKLNNIIMPSKTRLSQLLHGSVLRRRREVNWHQQNKKRSAKTKVLSKQKKMKARKLPTFPFKKKLRKAASLPIHGILKISTKATSPNKSSKAHKSRSFDILNHPQSRPAKRHVSFSDKNIFIGPTKKDGSPTKLPDASTASAASDKATVSKSVMANDSQCNLYPTFIEDASRTPLEIRDMHHSDQDNPVFVATIPTGTRSMSCCDTMMDRSVDLNQCPYGGSCSHFTDQCGQIPFSSSIHPSSSSIPTTVTRRGSESIMEYLFGGGVYKQSNSNIKFTNETPAMMNHAWPGSSTSPISLDPHLQRSNAIDDQSSQSLHHDRSFVSIAPQAKPSSHQLVSSACSAMPGLQLFPGGIRINNAAATHRDMCSNSDFIGLPLNSQGEFIQWPSRDHQMVQNHSDFTGCKRNSMRNSRDFRNNEEYMTSKGKFPDSPFVQINGTEWFQEPAPSNNHIHYLDEEPIGLCCNPSKKQNEIFGYNCGEQIPVDGHSQNVFQSVKHPTVRLMGKDVTIGVNKSNVHDFLNENRWIDKEFVVQGRPDPSTLTRFSHQKWLEGQPPGSAINNMLGSSDSRVNAPIICQMISLDPGSGSSWTPRNAMSINGCHASNLGPMWFNSTRPVEPSKLVSPSVHYDPFVHMPTSHVPHQHSRIPFRDERSYGIDFMDRNGSCQNHHHTCTDCIMPRWLTNTRSQVTFQDAPPSYSGSLSKYRPFRVSGQDVYHFNNTRPSIEFPCANSHAYAFSSNIATRGEPSINPHFRTLQSNSLMNFGQQEAWKGDLMTRPGIAQVGGLDQATISKRRLPSIAEDCMRPGKRPNSGMLSGQVFENGFYIHGSTHCTSSTLDFQGHHPNISGHVSPNPDGGPRSVPVKLSAGAKHILRPGGNIDSDSSIPVHSTIPFVVGSSSGKILDSQSKSAKIYQF